MRLVQSKQWSKLLFTIITAFVWSAVFSGNVLAARPDKENGRRVNRGGLSLMRTQAARSKIGRSRVAVGIAGLPAGFVNQPVSRSAVDLSAAVAPQITFWHKFDLPAGSVGTVEASADNGLTWTPVYTQTTPFTTWTEVNVD
ncbi:MAG: hypothetical protein GY805_19830, partial [Chloroflexi bacterium]|nr:hypothetical protein [Chloroflexota bacterium]